MENKLIIEKLVAIMQEIPVIAKDRKNPQQGYSFRGIDEMYNALHPLFAKHGVLVTSRITNAIREERQTKAGGTMFASILDIEFTFHAIDGSSISSVMRGEAMDTSDKASNKAMSTAYKYALMQMFLIPTKEEKDTEANSPEVKAKQIQKQQAKESPAPLAKLANQEEKAIIERLLSLQDVFDQETINKIKNMLPEITQTKINDLISRMSTKAIKHYLADDAVMASDAEVNHKLLSELGDLDNGMKIAHLNRIIMTLPKSTPISQD